MDQVRKILTWLKEQHFWVLSGLAVLIALACWWSAAGTLSTRYQTNEKQIKDGFNSVTSLQSNPFHPNQTILELQAEEVEKQAEEVRTIWEQLYERQREQVLEWPSALSEAFHKRVESLNFGDDIPTNLRQNYQDYVERHFPKLPEKIGARVLREGEAGRLGGGFRGGGEFAMQPGFVGAVGEDEDTGDYIVEWPSQVLVREELNFPQRPSPIRIWVTQENLWVYHTMLNVIRNTNNAAGATRPSNAAVRIVYALDVGRPAAQFSRTKDRIYKVPTAAPAAGAMGEFDPMGGGEFPGGEMPRGEMPSESLNFSQGRLGMGDEVLSPEQEAGILLDRRYVDAEGKPIPAGGGGGADMGMDPMADPMAGIPAGPVDMKTFGVEFKRLPVRMVLEMDQRWLPHLISECASQPLQVEVQEVRINPPDGGGVEGGLGGFRGGGGFGGGMSGANLFPDLSGIQQFSPQPHIATVVLQGVIYIFNKPDPSVLEVGTSPQVAGL